MKQFNVNATTLHISFICRDCGELIELEVSEIPQPNYAADSVADSENSDEITMQYDDDHSYRVVLYVNMVEGNVEVFDDETNEEITDIKVVEDIEEAR